MDTNYSLIISRLELFIRKYYLNLLIKGFIWLLACIFALFLLTTVTAYFAWLSVLSRSLILYTSMLLILSLGWQLVGRHLLPYFNYGKRIDHITASQLIGLHFPEISDKLLNTIQLHNISLLNPGNTALIQAGIDQKIHELNPVSFSNAVNIRENLRYIKFVLFPFITILLLLVISPAILRIGSIRMLHPGRIYTQPAPFRFLVLNSSLEVVQGGDLQLEITTRGTVSPAEMFLSDGASLVPMERAGRNRFRYQFLSLQQGRTIRLYASGIFSPPLVINVVPRPELSGFQVYLVYPAYLKRHTDLLQNTGDLVVPAGTIATWRLKTSNASGILFRFDSVSHRLADNPTHDLQFSRKILHSGRYSMLPVNRYGVRSDTLSYSIQAIPDQHPEIEVNRIPDSGTYKMAGFTGKIHDDYGFSSLSFVYGLCNAAGTPDHQLKQVSIPVSPFLTSQSFFYSWKPAEIVAAEGARLGGYFEVRDNDAVSGPKAVRSGTFYLVFPSTDSLSRQIRSNDQSVLSQLKSSQSQAAEIRSEAVRLHDKIATQKDINFEDRKEAQRILEKQQQLDQNLSELQKLSEKNSQLSKNDAATSLLKEKQQEMENLFKNLKDPKTQDLLARLQKLIQEKNKNSSGESLQNLQQDNKNLEKELDRLKSLYKKMSFEENVSRQADRLKDLAARQDAQAASPPHNPAKADAKQAEAKQAAIKQEFDKIKAAISELQKDKPADADMPDSQAEEKKISQALADAAHQLASNKPRQANKDQKDAAAGMKEMSNQLSEQEEQSGQEDMGKDLGSIRMILQNLLRVSFEQESLMQKLRTVSGNDPLYTSLVQKQYDLKEDLGLIRDSVYSLSRRVPAIQSFVNSELTSINTNLQSTIEYLGDRRQYEAAAKQQFIMTSVNNLAVLLSNTEAQMSKAMKNAKSKPGKKGGKGGGPSQEELGKLQEALNKEMQQSLQNPRSNPGNMSEELARMAARQQAIREAYEQLDRDGNAPNKSLTEALKKMDESETDLLNRRLNTSLMNRQKEIMSHLLEADKAGREQKQDNKREAKQGKDLPPAQVADLTRIEQEKSQQEELIKTILPDLNSFYKTRINMYFKTLNEGK